MARVLVTETLPPRALDVVRAAGHEVDERVGLSPEELLEVVPGAAALIVRSATKVTAEVLEAATALTVVGRAGVGVDNIDVEAATRRGVLVVNAPVSNILSNAEHTLALLLAQARNIPAANAALKGGTWHRARFTGVELAGKTLGILGLGNVGRLVAQRAHAFGMRVVAWDKFVTAERARQLNVELLELDEVAAQSDFLAVHLVKRPEYMGIVGKELLAKAKPGIRIVNTARGGLVDEDALAEAIRSGVVAGAAIDVFEDEPKEGGAKSSPLFDLDPVVVTPHLGASTAEAQDKAGVTIAEQVVLALAGDFVTYAVNIQATEASEAVRPFLSLAEQLGRVFASLSGGLPETLDVSYEGAIGEHDTRILTLAVLKGLFANAGTEQVSYVNAPQLAEERGLRYRESSTTSAQDYVNLVTLSSDDHSLAGTLTGLRSEPRIVMLDGHVVDVPPAPNMLVVRNDDRRGMIGIVGTAVAEAGVNIANMAVGQSPTGGTAVMVLATDQPMPADAITKLEAEPGILSVHAVQS